MARSTKHQKTYTTLAADSSVVNATTTIPSASCKFAMPKLFTQNGNTLTAPDMNFHLKLK